METNDSNTCGSCFPFDITYYGGGFRRSWRQVARQPAIAGQKPDPSSFYIYYLARRSPGRDGRGVDRLRACAGTFFFFFWPLFLFFSPSSLLLKNKRKRKDARLKEKEKKINGSFILFLLVLHSSTHASLIHNRGVECMREARSRGDKTSEGDERKRSLSR